MGTTRPTDTLCWIATLLRVPLLILIAAQLGAVRAQPVGAEVRLPTPTGAIEVVKNPTAPLSSVLVREEDYSIFSAGVQEIGRSEISMFATAGMLQSSSWAQATSGWGASPPSGGLASLTDILRIGSVDHAGQQGFADITVHHPWVLDPKESTGSLEPFWGRGVQLFLKLGDNSIEIDESDQSNGHMERRFFVSLASGEVYALPIESSFTVRIPVTFGEDLAFRWSLSTWASAARGFDRFDPSNPQWGIVVSSSSAAAHAFWGGMVVYDEHLNVIGAELNSAIGMDYRRSYAPVPEASSVSYIALGVALMVMAVRRVRTRSAPTKG